MSPNGPIGQFPTGGLDPDDSPAILRMPEKAMVPGIAKDSNGKRVGVFGSSENNVGVWGKSTSGDAGRFEGNVDVQGNMRVTGNITTGGDIVLSNADCAEDFDIASDVDAGTVMVLNDEGALVPSNHPYDKRVAGVISGAGDYKPGIVLDKQTNGHHRRKPVALLGKVFCKVDATKQAVEVGDLLTTSSTPGYAMKVQDPTRALGTIIGKALRPLDQGQGLIPILIALQ